MRLPLELLAIETLTHLEADRLDNFEDFRAVCALCLVSRAFAPLCQRKIFSKIAFSSDMPWNSKMKSLSRLGAIFRASPRLALHVRFLQYPVHFADFDKWNIVAEVLSQLSGITDLKFEGIFLHGRDDYKYQGMPPAVAETLFDLVCTPCLKTLSILDLPLWLIRRLPSGLESLSIRHLSYSTIHASAQPNPVIAEVIDTIPIIPLPQPAVLNCSNEVQNILLGILEDGADPVEPYIHLANLRKYSIEGDGIQNKVEHIAQQTRNLVSLSWQFWDNPVDFTGFFELFQANHHTLRELFVAFPIDDKIVTDSRGYIGLAQELEKISEDWGSQLSTLSIFVDINRSDLALLEGTLVSLEQPLTRSRFPRLEKVVLIVCISWFDAPPGPEYDNSEGTLASIIQNAEQQIKSQFLVLFSRGDLNFICRVKTQRW